MPFFPTLVSKGPEFSKDAEGIAKSLKTAMKGIGTDEQRIIRDLTSITNQERQAVKERYQAMYGNTLEQDLKDELKGDFEDIVIALLKPRYDFEAECIRKAIKGFGTREHVVIELLCTKDSSEVEKLKEAYKRAYNSDLENDLASEENGPLGRVLRAVATGDRPTSGAVDNNLAAQEAKELYDAGEGKFGTDENELVRVLASRSFAQLRATFDEYKKIGGKDIEDAIKGETEGHLEDAFITIVQSIRNRPAYYARQLFKAMENPGTKEQDLIRIIVSRCEADMGLIKKEYKNLYRRALYDDLKNELRGDFEEIVLKLVGQD